MSVPGQTMGVSVFTDFLIEALGISRVDLSLAYMIGTISSALVLTFAGKLYDYLGARKIGTAVSILFGGALLFMSKIDTVSEFIKSFFPESLKVFSIICVMTLGFFILRFLGQGVLTLVSRNTAMKWFNSDRGKANAIMGIIVSFGFSYAPRLLNSLIAEFTWSGAWSLIGLIVGVVFTITFFIFSRDNPKECGLIPDGKKKELKSGGKESNTTIDFTLKEAQSTYTFWIFTGLLTMSALFITGFTFNIVSIFNEAGMDRETAISIFLPAAIISVILNFTVSWASDYVKLKYILMLQAAGLMMAMISTVFLSKGIWVYILIIGYGINSGIFGLLTTVTWPRFYGTKHLGAISGFSMSALVAGSAIGPWIMSLSLKLSGSYSTSGFLFFGITLVIFLMAPWAHQPKHKSEM
ncbi:MAG: MFS transporter [Candidatus Pacearchaeota archaeon]|nr:MFS transporter [Candidatus Pacearchaeota archaeon]